MSAGDEPQFERMEPRAEAAAGACSACQRALPDEYFEAAGRVFCPACKDAVLASQTAGSGLARLVKAALLGTLAAAVSAAAWYAIVNLTGYELGIVAVVVGLAVGGGVRLGAERRGGWPYQTLAVLLTYLAIAASYAPLVLESFREEAAKSAAEQAGVGEGAGAETPEPGAAPAAGDDPALLMGAVLVALALPVLQLMDGGFLGALIVGFALYEAWRINKRQTIAFSGPFRLQRSASSSPARA